MSRISALAVTLRQIGRYLSVGGHFTLPLVLLRRAFAKAKTTATIEDFDGTLTIDLNLHEHMQRRIFWMGYYSLDIIAFVKQNLRPGMVCVDVGANIGEITLVASKLVGDSGRVISFEPMPSIVSILRNNVARNGLSNVTVVANALSNEEGVLPIFLAHDQHSGSEENLGLGTLFADTQDANPAAQVHVTTLDFYMNRSGTDRLDMVKIDIEGAELYCLQGALDSIVKYLPVLIVEIQSQSARNAGYKKSEILNLLSPLGYDFFTIGKAGSLIAVDEKSLVEFQNVACIPSQHKMLGKH